MPVELIGLEKIREHIKKQQERMSGSNSEFMNQAALLVVGAAQDAFRGNPLNWKELAPSTIKKKGNSQILIDTGKLSSTLKPVIGEDYVGVSYQQYYGKFHQDGTGVPQRAVRFTENGKKALIELRNKALSWAQSK